MRKRSEIEMEVEAAVSCASGDDTYLCMLMRLQIEVSLDIRDYLIAMEEVLKCISQIKN